jgi:pSer/pThr/pTyr-binding forkhead associated (FHA) protein
MDDDQTLVRSHGSPESDPESDRTQVRRPDVLYVTLYLSTGEAGQISPFSSTFTVGRALDNAVVVDDPLVSRHHLEVRWEHGDWWALNLQSKNGVSIDGRLIRDRERLGFPAVIGLGGSQVTLHIDKVAPPEPVITEEVRPAADHTGMRSETHLRKLSPEEIKARLLADDEAEDSGDYTKFVRRIIREDRTVRTRSYRKVIWVLAGLFAVSVCLAGYQHLALSNARQLALDMFYDIKALEVSLAQADINLEQGSGTLEKTLEAIASEQMRISQEKLKQERERLAAERKRMLAERQRLANMKAKYRQYVEEVNALRLRFPTSAKYEDELIAKVARELGESELELPEDFVAEVRKYIRYWQGSARIQMAMNNMEQGGYLPVVVEALKKQGLPIYFAYLPLQESNYDAQALGPETRFGIAKGAWQLLPSTAQEYGLKTGPLALVREYDSEDARFDFPQATQAGARYLKRIYGTEAQASGLLVMASYNYGDTRVREMIQQMPDNPRDKNFWKFVQKYELPRETHDYVFYIFSAAVIGEDPKHFGFNFAPPLYELEKESGGRG